MRFHPLYRPTESAQAVVIPMKKYILISKGFALPSTMNTSADSSIVNPIEQQIRTFITNKHTAQLAYLLGTLESNIYDCVKHTISVVDGYYIKTGRHIPVLN
jgi:hypothetical protein